MKHKKALISTDSAMVMLRSFILLFQVLLCQLGVRE